MSTNLFSVWCLVSLQYMCTEHPCSMNLLSDGCLVNLQYMCTAHPCSINLLSLVSCKSATQYVCPEHPCSMNHRTPVMCCQHAFGTPSSILSMWFKIWVYWRTCHGQIKFCFSSEHSISFTHTCNNDRWARRGTKLLWPELKKIIVYSKMCLEFGMFALLRMWRWWSLCALYLFACQVVVATGNSGLCCCAPCYGCCYRALWILLQLNWKWPVFFSLLQNKTGTQRKQRSRKWHSNPRCPHLTRTSWSSWTSKTTGRGPQPTGTSSLAWDDTD